MKSKRPLWISVLVLLLFAVGFAFLYFKNDTATVPPQLGHYVSVPDKLAYLELKTGQEFELSRHIATSYNPYGNYEVDGTALILHSNEGPIVFEITASGLLIKSGEIVAELIKEDQLFVLEPGS